MAVGFAQNMPQAVPHLARLSSREPVTPTHHQQNRIGSENPFYLSNDETIPGVRTRFSLIEVPVQSNEAAFVPSRIAVSSSPAACICSLVIPSCTLQ